MSIPLLAHKYIIVSVSEPPFNSPWLIFPNWNEILCIINVIDGTYTDCQLWKDETETPIWKDITEDQL